MPLSSSLSGGGSVGGPRGGGGGTILLIIQAINQASKELQKVSKDITGLSSTTKQAGSDAADAGGGIETFISSLKGVGIIIGSVIAGIYGFSKALEAALAAGEQGAAVRQTAISFDQMTKSVGASVVLLQQLQVASRGTIPDMQLMSYATTALAGASGEFGEQMGRTLPHLLEIAKAAQKANPALGSVDYQFQSLIIGLKRLSPRLIDNTGLQIKLGAAYEVLAKKLGKNREDLDAQEQQMALLNATLAAGDRLIEQIGGSVDSLTDPFAQFQTSVQNITNDIKAGLSPALSELAQGLEKVINPYSEITRILSEQQTIILNTSDTWEEYANRIVSLAGKYNMLVDAEGNLMFFEKGRIPQLKQLVDWNIALNEQAYNQAKGYDILNGVTVGLADSRSGLIDMSGKLIDREAALAILTGEVTDEEQILAEQTKKTKEAFDQYKKAMEELSFVMSGPVGKAIDDFTEKQSTLQAKIQEARRELEILTGTDVPLPPGVADLATRFIIVTDQIKFLQDALKKGLVVEGNIPTVTAQITSLKDEAQKLREEFAKQTGLPLTPAQIEKIAELQGKIRDTEEALKAETEAMKRNTKEVMFNMAQKQLLAAVEAGLIQDTNESGSAYDEITEILTTMARTMGLVDDETVAASIASQDLLGQLTSGKITSEEYATSMGELAEAIAEAALTGQNLIDIIARIKDKKVTITIETKYKGRDPNDPYQYEQFGGPVLPNRPYIVGEVGPELFVPNTAGTIIPNNELQNKGTPMMAGQGISINFYDTKVTNDADIQVLAYRIANEISARQRWR